MSIEDTLAQIVRHANDLDIGRAMTAIKTALRPLRGADRAKLLTYLLAHTIAADATNKTRLRLNTSAVTRAVRLSARIAYEKKPADNPPRA
jgi:hypothetical protein